MDDGRTITLLINSLGGGGAERVCVTLANGFVSRGWQVELVVLNLNRSIFQNDLAGEVQLTVLGTKHARCAMMKLAWFIRRKKPTKFLVFNHQLAVLLVCLRFFLRSNYRIIARNINTLSKMAEGETSFWHKRVVQSLTKFFYARVDKVIAQSSGMRQDLIENYHIAEKKIEVIANPLNPELENFFEGFERGAAGRGDFLLCVGRLAPAKAFHYAIRAFARLAPDFPDLRLKFVGEGRSVVGLKSLCNELGVAGRVDFEGFQLDLIPYYLGARATLLTSLYEGFPNVLVESIALGTPVVAFDCPSGPNDIVRDGVNGYLVSFKDEEELVLAIRRALDRVWERGQVASSARPYSSTVVLNEYIRACV